MKYKVYLRDKNGNLKVIQTCETKKQAEEFVKRGKFDGEVFVQEVQGKV